MRHIDVEEVGLEFAVLSVEITLFRDAQALISSLIDGTRTLNWDWGCLGVGCMSGNLHIKAAATSTQLPHGKELGVGRIDQVAIMV